MRYEGASERILDKFARRLTADGDAAPGAGGASPVAPASDAPPAGGGAAPPAGAAPDAAPAEPTSLLSEPPKPEPVVVETDEQKAERLKNETPEQKAEREGKEAEARAEALKPYDALKLPEGVPADQPLFSTFKSLALDEGIAPEKAQKLVDLMVPKIVEAQKAPYELWADTQEAWVKEVKEDPVIGKDLDKNIAIASRAIDNFGTPEDRLAVRKALAFTGAGNNPAIVRWMHQVGMTLKEGSPVSAKPAAGAKPSLAELAYPSMQPNPT